MSKLHFYNDSFNAWQIEQSGFCSCALINSAFSSIHLQIANTEKRFFKCFSFISLSLRLWNDCKTVFTHYLPAVCKLARGTHRITDSTLLTSEWIRWGWIFNWYGIWCMCWCAPPPTHWLTKWIDSGFSERKRERWTGWHTGKKILQTRRFECIWIQGVATQRCCAHLLFYCRNMGIFAA